jgi:hypothetical protein
VVDRKQGLARHFREAAMPSPDSWQIFPVSGKGDAKLPLQKIRRKAFRGQKFAV